MANPAAKTPEAPPAAAAPAAAEKKSGGVAVYIVIGLLMVLVIGAGVAWEMFRSRMEELQQGQSGESRIGDPHTGPQRDRKSRELKPKEEPVVAAPAPEEDDLTGLGKKKKPPPPKQYPPVERAWRSVKADYEKLQGRNESTAKKYRMKMLTLEDRKDSIAEASFIKEATALEEQLKEELSKPENQ